MNSERPTVGILAYRSKKALYDQVLLVTNTSEANVPGVSWPGGLLDDPHKEPIQIAVQELEEETGLLARPDQLIPWDHGFETYVSPSTTIAYPLIMFLCTELEGALRQPRDPSEAVKDPKWVEISALSSLPLAPRVELFVNAGREHLRGIRKIGK